MDNNNSIGEWNYNFPEISLPSDHTSKDQLDKIREELEEADCDIIFERYDDALLECIDVLQAAETLHRILVKRLGKAKVDKAIAKVIQKNHTRNYFTKENK